LSWERANSLTCSGSAAKAVAVPTPNSSVSSDCLSALLFGKKVPIGKCLTLSRDAPFIWKFQRCCNDDAV
jgi:hypothetical protein